MKLFKMITQCCILFIVCFISVYSAIVFQNMIDDIYEQIDRHDYVINELMEDNNELFNENRQLEKRLYVHSMECRKKCQNLKTQSK